VLLSIAVAECALVLFIVRRLDSQFLRLVELKLSNSEDQVAKLEGAIENCCEGLAGLADRPDRRPKPSLTSEEAERLRARLDAGPGPEDGICTLRGEDVQRILAEEFRKLRKIGAVYKLLHRLGYASLAPPSAAPPRRSSGSGSF